MKKSNYKHSIMRELGIREAQIPPTDAEINPEELEAGVADEMGQNGDDEDLAKKIASSHLSTHGDFYSKLKQAGGEPSAKEKMLSPTMVRPNIIGVAVRGSVTGGLPSGADQRGDITPTNLGGYEKVPVATDNSELVDKTPKNPQIDSSKPITQDPKTEETPHPHQIQNDANEPPQAVTGAETDSQEEPSFKLKDQAPKEVDIDVAEKKEEQPKEENKDDGKVPTEKLEEVRKGLAAKAAAGTMNEKESKVFQTIMEVLQKRGQGLETKLYGKKTLQEKVTMLAKRHTV